ncbi:MAG: hypothetical protein JXB62_02580 [Pirellulales bacterium]|nr:hypothetical protein [Pirellulales bacterium]
MPQFVILRHNSPRGLHWDLMIESGGVLRTWALSQPPAPGAEIACESLPDHRAAYLDYEGPISGERGSVSRWDHGTCRIVEQGEAAWILELSGQKLRGRAIVGQSPEAPQAWRFSFTPRPAP